MRKLKRIPALALAAVACVAFLCLAAACSGGERKRTIVCSIFPQYDWVREILGTYADDFDIILLTKSGVDLHNYQLKASDRKSIMEAEMFVYVGGESDSWVTDSLLSSTDAVCLSLLAEVEAVEEEIKEGMSEEDGDTDLDEHVWLSLRNAAVLTESIAECLCGMEKAYAEERAGKDPGNAESYMREAEQRSLVYRYNAEVYEAELLGLDCRYEEVVAAASHDTLVFAESFPFRYLVDDYGLDYYAAFKGCTSNGTVTPGTIAFLAGKIDELGLGCIMTIETSDGAAARTIRSATRTKDQEILVMNSCQSVTERDLSSGVTYLSVMEENLLVLEKALG